MITPDENKSILQHLLYNVMGCEPGDPELLALEKQKITYFDQLLCVSPQEIKNWTYDTISSDGIATTAPLKSGSVCILQPLIDYIQFIVADNNNLVPAESEWQTLNLNNFIGFIN